MTPKEQFYKTQAETIIGKLKERKMEGYYCANVEEAKEKLVELLGKNGKKKQIGYGGSVTLDDAGFKDAVTKAGHELILRESYKTDEELKECKKKMITADAFMMSTNAITVDGELINIDGRGNRTSFMIYGPDEVYIIAGMNKVVTSIDEGIKRARNVAAPQNTIRLNRPTPCASTGKCGDCLKDSICCQMVVTRASSIPGRIKVILVGEELGY